MRHSLEPDESDRGSGELGRSAEFVVGDVRTADFGSADSIVILDVLHDIEYAEQRRVLERAHAALRIADGVLLLRDGNAGSG